MSGCPSSDVVWSDWIVDDIIMGDRMDEDYTSSHRSEPAYTSYPTGCPRLTEESHSSHLGHPIPYFQDLYASDVSDPPGLIAGSASSIGSNSPPSPRSLRSESPTGSPERELPQTMADYPSAADLTQGWESSTVDQYYGTSTGLSAFPSDDYTTDTTYSNMVIDSSYPAVMDAFVVPQYDASSSPTTTDSGYSGGSHHKRSRHLDDPDKVAKVRSIGGCIRCKMGKYSCEALAGPCPRCIKYANGYAATCCLRQMPSQVIGSENLWGSSPSVRTPRSGRDLERIFVYFPWVNGMIQNRPLQLTVQRVEQNEDFCLYQEHVPTDDTLQKWVENQMALKAQYDGQPPFSMLIERLVMEYANSRNTSSSKRINLVKKVHTLNCMFQIWKSEELFVPDANSPQGFSPLGTTVRVQLQMMAKACITRVQYEIMKEFDKSIKEGTSKDRDLPLWACLWQTIFIYMELSTIQPVKVAYGLANEGVVDRTQKLYVTLMVMLATHFRNHSPIIALKNSESEVKRSCGGDSRVFEAFKNVVRARESFHQDVLKGASEGSYWSCLWKQLIIDTEKDLDRRRKKPKSSSK